MTDKQEVTYAIVPQMPAMTLEMAGQRYNEVAGFVKTLMVEGKDFGPPFPGGNKPTLLKPGAEKLTTFFGLTPRFIDETVIENFDNPDKPFFFYRRKCQLWRGDKMIGEASGSCNSREKKYRWRTANRSCPECGEETIIKGKDEYGGGWLCWKKQGGCGFKWPDGAPEIEDQEVGQVENPDVYDLGNTVLKMADKRALIAATLIAVNASEFFTQDFDIDEETIIREVVAKAKPAQRAQPPVKSKEPDNITELYTAAREQLGYEVPDAVNVLMHHIKEQHGMSHDIGTFLKAKPDNIKELWQVLLDDKAAESAALSV